MGFAGNFSRALQIEGENSDHTTAAIDLKYTRACFIGEAADLGVADVVLHRSARSGSSLPASLEAQLASDMEVLSR